MKTFVTLILFLSTVFLAYKTINSESKYEFFTYLVLTGITGFSSQYVGREEE